MDEPKKRRTLLPLIGVLAILVLLATGIALPNLLNAIDRSNQKKTMGDMRSIGTAAESYSIDYNVYPPSAAAVVPVLYGSVSYPSTTLGVNVTRFITPTYLKAVPLTDGWSSWFLYGTNASRQDYAIVSAGKDGVLQPATAAGPVTDFDADIVFADGQFTRYPEGVCQ